MLAAQIVQDGLNLLRQYPFHQVVAPSHNTTVRHSPRPAPFHMEATVIDLQRAVQSHGLARQANPAAKSRRAGVGGNFHSGNAQPKSPDL